MSIFKNLRKTFTLHEENSKQLKIGWNYGQRLVGFIVSVASVIVFKGFITAYELWRFEKIVKSRYLQKLSHDSDGHRSLLKIFFKSFESFNLFLFYVSELMFIARLSLAMKVHYHGKTSKIQTRWFFISKSINWHYFCGQMKPWSQILIS